MTNVIQAVKQWSKYQIAIFAFITNGVGSAIIKAVAGSGKTTTIVEAYNYTKKLGTAIFLAFNKAIADELFKRGLNAKTFHSLCNSVVSQYVRQFGVYKANTNKLWDLINANMSDNDAKVYGAFARKLVGLAKQAGIGCLVDDTYENWMELVEHHDIELESENANIKDGIAWAQKLLNWSNDIKTCRMYDFDDMLYLCVKEGLVLPKFDFVFVDEAQDTNAIQRAILRKLMNGNTRIIAVGDPAQAIYGFRGADSNSLELIAKEFNCTELPLTVSYRCPRSVVKYAQQWVKHIEAADTAPEGAVTHMGDKWDVSIFNANDLVVCRTTKPIVELGYKMLKARKPVHIMGRDIGEGLKSLIKRMNAQGIDRLLVKLSAWTDREVEKAKAKKGGESKAAAIQDKTDAILCLIAGMEENNRTIPALLTTIDSLFADKNNCTTLATIHKAKGLEAKRVYWLNRSACPSKWARQDWQYQQELNLCYVAATRAMSELILLEEPKGNGESELDKAA
jgi:superfamily I DNA/RNA helicase